MKSNKAVISSCEKDFILSCIRKGKRLDGRNTYDYRELKISLGLEYGHCEVLLGKTRVLAQVSSEVVSPTVNRPSEGQLFFNVELSPMASPAYEVGRMSGQMVELNRLLERVYKHCECVDVEALCIIAGEKVWSIRVDITIMDDGGNIADCASIAAITALSHFRHPDVEISDQDFTILPVTERHPVSLGIHHTPIYISFSFFHNGEFLLVDATDREERVMEGQMMIAMNINREICTIQMNGGLCLEKDQILRCSQIARVKVAEITELIQKALRNDEETRKNGKRRVQLTNTYEKISEINKDSSHINSKKVLKMDTSKDTQIEKENTKESLKGFNTAEIGHGGWNTWINDDTMEFDSDQLVSDDTNKKRLFTGDMSCSSSEEDTILLTSAD
ncbi:exosome complex component RRP45-like isoform X2 [Xenia sp. Carnegie-2017]|uniref:exosome complex component RRP45-like isoform X2 n=1 Tax=Xenia sp. Carnegie-2017 TaxID=2897299 RepID=UPI001F0396D1|nr:exosome complex component RRP45-like isoform X2 [Xenia sp. Carnegie-2017]